MKLYICHSIDFILKYMVSLWAAESWYVFKFGNVEGMLYLHLIEVNLVKL